MCVITLVETARPTDEQVRQMWEQNPKGGGGVAWRETVGGIRVVRWRKGLSKDEMIELNHTLPLPYVLHFRQPSHDTSDSKLACHPFQIDGDATSGFEGTFDGWVLFHNGTWTGWRPKLESLAINACRKLPSGPWSDTRGLAWATNILGWGFLEMVNEKVLAFGPEDLDIEMFGGPWSSVKVPETSNDTIVVSNTTWERTTFQVTDRRGTRALLDAAQSTQTGGKAGGPSQQDTFPCARGGAGSETLPAGNQPEPVQKAAQGAGARGEPAPGASGPLTKCSACQKVTAAGTTMMGSFFCYQCWSDAERKQGQKPWVGTCRKCHVAVSGMKQVLNDEWICHSCWDTNGKPKIYFARPAHAA